MDERKVTHHKCWEVCKVWVDTETGCGSNAYDAWQQMTLEEKHNHSSDYEDFDTYDKAVSYMQNECDELDFFVYGYQENGKETYHHRGIVIWYVEWGAYEDRTVAYSNCQEAYCQFGWADDYE